MSQLNNQSIQESIISINLKSDVRDAFIAGAGLAIIYRSRDVDVVFGIYSDILSKKHKSNRIGYALEQDFSLDEMKCLVDFNYYSLGHFWLLGKTHISNSCLISYLNGIAEGLKIRESVLATAERRTKSFAKRYKQRERAASRGVGVAVVPLALSPKLTKQRKNWSIFSGALKSDS